MSERRISEKELILPTLYLAVCNGGRITTSELIKQLTAMMRPSGIDAEILSAEMTPTFHRRYATCAAIIRLWLRDMPYMTTKVMP